MNLTKLQAGFAIATTVLGFGGSVATGAFWLSKRFDQVDQRVTKIENVVKVLNTEQPAEYKEIINQLMAEKKLADEALAQEQKVHRFGNLPLISIQDGIAADTAAPEKPKEETENPQ